MHYNKYVHNKNATGKVAALNANLQLTKTPIHLELEK